MIAILSIFFVFISLALIPFVSIKIKGVLAAIAILINAIYSSFYAVQAIFISNVECVIISDFVFGAIPIKIDALSGFFILLFNLVFILTFTYGLMFFTNKTDRKNQITLHAIAFVVLHLSLISICIIQNFIAFLLSWELMALSAFLLIIYNHEQTKVIKAGINYLIQSHICIVFLLIGFIWISSKTASYNFTTITAYTSNHQAEALIIFLIFFIGFAIKAGFVPFHTWLPDAHPAAPSHISGLLSGILIKIGIFGILKMILLIKTNYLIVGYFILSISVISGLYGVILAIVQHNLKRLLAYHSIENIGIIGMGIGLGCIGIGAHNHLLIVLGFTTALLHTLNHALFKSLLFFTSGNIYLATANVQIEKQGGLLKFMPHTGILFMIGSIAICGLPPFNGFISELILYKGLYELLKDSFYIYSLIAVFYILGLVLIGGLAIFCFTKAFGIIFLGNRRYETKKEIREIPKFYLIPLYTIAFFIIFIGIFPKFVFFMVQRILILFISDFKDFPFFEIHKLSSLFQDLNYYFIGFILFFVLLLLIKKVYALKKTNSCDITWGCAYLGETTKCQYTPNSFAKTYSKLFKPLFVSSTKEQKPMDILPHLTKPNTHLADKIEKVFIDFPLRLNKIFMNKFLFLQNGRLQTYIIYGIVFILGSICLPIIYNKLNDLILFLKHL